MESFIGSFFPFAKTKAQRVAAHDPRLSVEERYATEQDYQQRLQKAAADLVSERLMLERDIPRVVERAHQEWTMSPAP
jgi:prophage tail gpP-like protein